MDLAQLAARFPRQRLAAGVLMRDDRGRVLLAEPTYKRDWDIPGGVVEADETPWDAAIREVREELGLEIRLGRVLVVDHLTAQAAADTLVPDLLSAGRITEDQAERVASVLTGGPYWVFDGGLVTEAEIEAITVDGAEIRTVRLVDADGVREFAKDSLARRVFVARDALKHGRGQCSVPTESREASESRLRAVVPATGPTLHNRDDTPGTETSAVACPRNLRRTSRTASIAVQSPW